jgi:hypothetical protein
VTFFLFFLPLALVLFLLVFLVLVDSLLHLKPDMLFSFTISFSELLKCSQQTVYWKSESSRLETVYPIVKFTFGMLVLGLIFDTAIFGYLASSAYYSDTSSSSSSYSSSGSSDFLHDFSSSLSAATESYFFNLAIIYAGLVFGLPLLYHIFLVQFGRLAGRKAEFLTNQHLYFLRSTFFSSSVLTPPTELSDLFPLHIISNAKSKKGVIEFSSFSKVVGPVENVNELNSLIWKVFVGASEH